MFDQIAERKIAEALARGELDHLPGEGRPLELDDDALVPEDLRLAYRILKNAGFAPSEVEANALRKLDLIGARIEKRYFRKALAKLGR
jgi:hypothetical protein